MMRLKPKEDKFFELFVENSKLSHRTALALQDFMNNLEYPETKYVKIKEMEHEGDNMIHEIFQQLNKTFITPLDREDIHMIAKALDEVTDFIEQTASRFVMYNVKKANDASLAISEMIVDCTKEMVALMETLKTSKKTTELPGRIIEINRIEEIGDIAYRTAVTEMFRTVTDPIEIIKWKDIYENLENVLDACEDVANIIEGVVMKHA